MAKKKVKIPTVDEAMARAAKREQELPEIIQVVSSDWDTVVLAAEIVRLRQELREVVGTVILAIKETDRFEEWLRDNV